MRRIASTELANLQVKKRLGDYFIICSCGSGVQVRACADEVEEKAKENGFAPAHIEGYRSGNWILMDFGDIIVHIMERETRDFYSLERLWDDAVKLEIKID